ncbi:DUF6328 family protein [Streptomyces sp. NBS 14/10]|uniref:DUF6328 family protein n=1 Tax=Streptomyces sp. NBS 14/10 TaxID=1945643 RepID=UPI000B7FC8FB|nr:DUF6328 family protein [Streptomyces sp. NBS 14/10]KAK1186525.1 DUF6328 family protein [Streptomyces sp. NBS 14/10]NUP42448.1 hypothetical protein [Streptomyces sp.]NUS81445.1 hypothetical protein [Streptomyces sp.]
MHDDDEAPRRDGRAAPSGREETREEQADRKWAELLQEVRVTQTGMQILFAFLLTVAFTPRFQSLGHADRTIYVVTVLLGAAATGALIAPVSLHRIVTGRRLKPETVHIAARFTVAGLVLLLCTVVSALLLILRVVVADVTAAWVTVAALVWFVSCWIAPAVWLCHRHRKDH